MRNLMKFLILQETDNPKKLLIFSEKKAVLTFWEKENPKKFFIFQETELFYISGNPKNLSKTKKFKKLLSFQEVT